MTIAYLMVTIAGPLFPNVSGMTSTGLTRLPRWLRPAGVRGLVLLLASVALLLVAVPIESAAAGHAVTNVMSRNT